MKQYDKYNGHDITFTYTEGLHGFSDEENSAE